MITICPTITAENSHVYREQVERVQKFASRIHIDLMDGDFTKNKSVEISTVWWPDEMLADIHLMFRNPEAELETLTKLRPHMVIVHAESNCDIPKFASVLREANIKTGVALFPETKVDSISYILPHVQQVLIFSGNLGHQGGSVADFSLLSKIAKIKQAHPFIEEIAWDGGISDKNATQLVEAGVQVLNAGGYIHTATSPERAYQLLCTEVQ